MWSTLGSCILWTGQHWLPLANYKSFLSSNLCGNHPHQLLMHELIWLQWSLLILNLSCRKRIYNNWPSYKSHIILIIVVLYKTKPFIQEFHIFFYPAKWIVPWTTQWICFNQVNGTNSILTKLSVTENLWSNLLSWGIYWCKVGGLAMSLGSTRMSNWPGHIVTSKHSFRRTRSNAANLNSHQRWWPETSLAAVFC